MIVATTTAGTTLADRLDRSLGIGYLGGTSILLALLAATLVWWHGTLGSVSIGAIMSRKAEIFYWTTIMFSQTLGTALGDWMLDKPHANDGLELSRYVASAVLAMFILACLALLPQRAERETA